jgi:O-antigen/teichoic acid export membrane protein
MSTRRALTFSYLDRYATLVVFLLTSMVIARLLPPAEFGVYSITAVIVGFVAPFRDLGASQYLVNERDLTREHIKSVWALQLSLGLVIALVIFALREVIANAYGNPRIAAIMVVLAANSLVMPFGALTGAWLSRELRFDQLAVIRFSGALLGSATSVYFAWTGQGAISLAYGGLATSIVSAAVGAFFRPRGFPWLPGFTRIFDVVGFGASISLNTLFHLAHKGSPELIAGRLLGMQQTGFLARASGFVGLFERLVMDSIGPIALPIFSKLKRENADMTAAYLRGSAMLSALGGAMLGFMALMAHPMMKLLYGAQWDSAAEVARVLCLATICALPVTLSPPLLIATGRHWLVVALQAGNAGLQIVLGAIGASLGLWALGLSILATSALTTLLWVWFTHASLRMPFAGFLRSQAASFLVAAAATVVPALTLAFWPLESAGAAIAQLVLGGLGGAAGFVLAARALRHPIWSELHGLVRRVLPGIGPLAPPKVAPTGEKAPQ